MLSWHTRIGKVTVRCSEIGAGEWRERGEEKESKEGTRERYSLSKAGAVSSLCVESFAFFA